MLASGRCLHCIVAAPARARVDPLACLVGQCVLAFLLPHDSHPRHERLTHSGLGRVLAVSFIIVSHVQEAHHPRAPSLRSLPRAHQHPCFVRLRYSLIGSAQSSRARPTMRMLTAILFGFVSSSRILRVVSPLLLADTGTLAHFICPSRRP